jgi:putative membrane protein
MFQLSEHFLGDLVSAFGFGLVAILLIVLGFKVFDWLTPRCDFEAELSKGNIAVSITIAAVLLGICYVVAQVTTAIVGG